MPANSPTAVVTARIRLPWLSIDVLLGGAVPLRNRLFGLSAGTSIHPICGTTEPSRSVFSPRRGIDGRDVQTAFRHGRARPIGGRCTAGRTDRASTYCEGRVFHDQIVTAVPRDSSRPVWRIGPASRLRFGVAARLRRAASHGRPAAPHLFHDRVDIRDTRPPAWSRRSGTGRPAARL